MLLDGEAMEEAEAFTSLCSVISRAPQTAVLKKESEKHAQLSRK